MDPNNNNNSYRASFPWLFPDNNSPNFPMNLSQNSSQNSQSEPMQFSQNPQFSTQIPPNVNQLQPNNFSNPGLNPYLMQGFNPFMMQAFNQFQANIRSPSPRSSHIPVQADDDDVVHVAEPQTGRHCWGIEEDEALISSYMTVSTNPITGTYQKEGAFWAKVLNGYRIALDANTNLRARNLEAVRCRWKRICGHVTKWVACIEEAEKCISSGMNDLDVEVVAQRIWKKDQKEKFTMHQQFRMLRTYPRWAEIITNPDIPGNRPRSESGSGDKRPRLEDENDFDFNTPPRVVHSPTAESGQQSVSSVRPPGVKKSKRKGKGKVDVDAQAAAEAVSENQAKLMDKKMNVNRSDERILDKQILVALVNKTDKTEAEMSFMTMLLNKYQE